MSTQTTQNIWNFIVRESSLQEMANFGDYSGDFGRFFIYLFILFFIFIREISASNLETGRYGSKSGVSRIIRESWQRCQT